jgi:hypothetical protein
MPLFPSCIDLQDGITASHGNEKKRARVKTSHGHFPAIISQFFSVLTRYETTLHPPLIQDLFLRAKYRLSQM